MTVDLKQLERLAPAFKTLRREFHARPEASGKEFQTSEKIASLLQSWGLEVHRGIAQTGIVAFIRKGTGKKCIALRADMDALPIVEQNRFAHASKNPGLMHACGHDGHMATLLLATRYLIEYGRFDGTVELIFQPSEEQDGGAGDMIAEGILEKYPADCYYAYHNWPDVPEGKIGLNRAAIMASCNFFSIRIAPKTPQALTDPVMVSVILAQSLQGIISRMKRPIDPAVLSICCIETQSSPCGRAEAVTLTGTARTFSESVTDLLDREMHRIAEHVASAFDAEARVQFVRQVKPTVNNAACSARLYKAVKSLFGDEKVHETEPVMPSEDFSEFLSRRPGALFFVSNGPGSHREEGHGAGPCALHNPSYDFNDACLVPAAAVFAQVVEDYLQ